MNIGVFVPNWVGDAVMATPALRALRKKFSGERMIGILKPGIAPVFGGSSYFDETWILGDGFAGAYSPKKLILTMRQQVLDTCLLFTNSFGTACLAWLGGARERIGYARDGRSLLLTTRLHAPRTFGRFLPHPAVDSYLEIAYAVGCSPEPPVMELRTTPADNALADRVWKDAGLRSEDDVVTCNSSGAFGVAKLWPDEYFASLAVRMADQLGVHVLFLCGPEERARIGDLTQAISHPRVTSLALYEPSIGLSKACVRRSRLLVSTDSGPRHFGVAFGIPVVALFGPTHMRWSDTHYAGEVRLQKEMECCPCQKRTCPLGHHRCMTELSVDTVFHAVRTALSYGPTRSTPGREHRGLSQ